MNNGKNTLTLVNDVLTRCGQKSVGTLIGIQTPVKQALSFLNQVYEEIRLSVNIPALKQQLQIPYDAGTTQIDLTTYNTDAAFIAVQTVWVKNQNATYWSSLRYTPETSPWLESDTAETPMQFQFNQNHLLLYPTPSVGGVLRLMVEPPMTALTQNTDVPQLPQGTEYLLVLGTVAYLQQFLGEVQTGLLSFRLYEEGLLRLKKTYQPLFNHLRMKGPNTGYKTL